MLNFIGAAVFALIGAGFARYRGGNGFDLAQYAAVFALIGFLLGTVIMMVVPAPV